MQCNMGLQAAKCLYNAKEVALATQVFEKVGQVRNKDNNRLDILIHVE